RAALSCWRYDDGVEQCVRQLVAAVHGFGARGLIAQAAELNAQTFDLFARKAAAGKRAVLDQRDVVSRETALEAYCQRPRRRAGHPRQRSAALRTEDRDQVQSIRLALRGRERIVALGHRVHSSVPYRPQGKRVPTGSTA